MNLSRVTRSEPVPNAGEPNERGVEVDSPYSSTSIPRSWNVYIINFTIILLCLWKIMKVYLSGQLKAWRSPIIKQDLDTLNTQDMLVVRTKKIVFWRYSNGSIDNTSAKEIQRMPRIYMTTPWLYNFLFEKDKGDIRDHMQEKSFYNGLKLRKC